MDLSPTPLDLIRFHRIERDFYSKLVHQLNLNPERTKWVMALWLWFESIGHHEFIRHVFAYPDDVILLFVSEGNDCLERLLGRSNPNRGDELPLTTTLVMEPMDLRFFDYHRGVAMVRVNHFYHKVASIIFDENIIKAYGEESSGVIGGRVESLQGLVRSYSTLNPMAEPWSPIMNQSSEDQRSMFITFSRGYPLSREEIMEFFNARFGNCVEMVMIERATGGAPPMYGRVVFTSASVITTVLNGQQTAKFMIKGKHLWARIYVPRQNSS